MVKAMIDRGGCVGCGLCAEICAAVFMMAQDGLAAVHGDITPDNEDDAKDAMENCPVSVITIE